MAIATRLWRGIGGAAVMAPGVFVLGVFLILLGSGFGSAASAGKPVRLRMGLSDRLFLNLNENDARAAVQAWTRSIAGPSHLEVQGGAQLMGSDEIVQAIANHAIDGFSITTPEYVKVSNFVDPVIFMDEESSKVGVEYLLLVRQDSGIQDLAGLRGHSLLVYDYVSMALEPAWLQVLLAAANLEEPDRFFGKIGKSMQVSQAVLPVFFGRADACVVARRAFDTMSELNPQLRQRLRIVAASPQFVAAFVGLHKDSSSEIKTSMRKALLEMDQSPGGNQILTLFQCRKIAAVDSASLRPSADLLEQYERLKSRRAGAKR